jgi:flavin-dependent dehydrogenase
MPEVTVAYSSRQLGDTGTRSNGTHAVVIGSSMAGLLAARVLADHFAHVTVLERDRLPEGPSYRAAVPQARHVHGLLVRGYHVLQALFPRIDEDFAAAGAPLLDWTADLLMLGFAGWAVRYRSGLVSRFASRPLFDWLITSRLATYDSVHFLEQHQAVGLVSDGANGVRGVRVRKRGEEDGEATELPADLVVDASGRDSRTPEWLVALGYAAPEETAINAHLGYASRVYRRPSDHRQRWQGLLIGPKAPDHPRSGVLMPLEGDRWIVTLVGVGRDYPPTDDAAFLDFARSLRTPMFYDAIAGAEPLTTIHGYRRTENRLRHYERLVRWPERFVVLGDAVCAFNPAYGQGLTVAALGAQLLDQSLRHEARAHHAPALADLGRRFQRRLAGINATPWLMATGEDFRWPSTEGGRPGAVTRLTHRYMDDIMRLAARTPRASSAFMQVWHLQAGPALLFQPALLALVASQAVGRMRAPQPT